jgi:hypothetical protein
MPFGNGFAGQVRDNDIAERRQNMNPRAPLGVGKGFGAFTFKASEIGVHGRRDGEGRICRGRLGKRCDLASLPLSLKEIENIHSVGNRMIVRGGDCFDVIGLLA